MPIWITFPVWILVPVLATMSGAPETADTQVVEDWILHQWTHETATSEHEHVFAEWVDRYHDVPDAETLAKLRRSVRGRPQHPQHADLERYERRLREGPDTEEVRFWLGGCGSFRRSATNFSGYSDIVVTPREAWSVSPQQLTVFNPSNGIPEGYNHAPWEGVGRRVLGGLLHGAFSIRASAGEVLITDFSLVDGAWRCAISSREPATRLIAEGSWDPGRRTGNARSVRVARFDPSPEEVGRRWEFDGWGRFDLGGRGLFAVQREYAPDGRLVQETELRTLRPISEDEFRRVTRPPSLDRRADPVRGELSFLAVHRYAADGQASVVEVIDPNSGERTVIPERDFARNKNRRTLQLTGVLFALGAVVVVVGINQRLRSSTHA